MTTLNAIMTPSRRLDDECLERFRGRAADHDAAGAYPSEDLEDLRAKGWLRAALPAHRGGLGLDLAALAAEQRRMARYSAATALSTCMHHYWVGLAATLDAMSLQGGERILQYVEAGELLASGHAEAGNDVPLALSTTQAQRVPGGYRLHGRKLFGSLGPHWDRLGYHAVDLADPEHPMVVHGFVRRDAEGVRVVPNWDAHGMRATESHDTVLDGAFAADEDVVCVVPAGPSSAPAVAIMQVWALTLIANVYVGIAERALELAVEHAGRRTSVAVPGGAMARNPFVQHQAADMYLALEAARAQLDGLAEDWVRGVDHGPMWGPKVLSAKWHATTAAHRVVELACEVAGGASFRRGTELERLSRDVRAARFHPGSDAFVHEIVGKAVLGLAGEPRW